MNNISNERRNVTVDPEENKVITILRKLKNNVTVGPEENTSQQCNSKFNIILNGPKFL